MTSVSNSAAANLGATSAPTLPPAKSANDPLANEETFLKLLVSQLKNQDPLSPPDTSQFVSQLTSYSQLEQLIGIRQNTDTSASTATTPTGTKVATAAV